MSSLNRRRILIVDDEPFMRATIKHMLRSIGQFEVSEAGDGAAALTLVSEVEPELILCDIGMLPMSGLEFVRRLRGLDDPGLARTQVIMLTANAQERTVKDAARLAISGYLLKPVSPRRLGARMRALFEPTASGLDALLQEWH
jgi:CheY-like chemotaxis protein